MTIIEMLEQIGKLIHRFGWDQDILQTKKETQRNKNRAVTLEITAAISAAVTEYQAKQ
jgi:Na+-transporting methylmalonyl-CoA/oxaloacetate decarboxylase gamma subunit